MTDGSARFWWERPDLRYADGRLTFAGQDLAGLAEAAEGPLFVYSAARVSANVDRVRAALAATGCDHRLLFAMKANRFPPLLRHLARSRRCGIDICSPGELDLALHCGFRPDELSFTGAGVSTRDLDRLLAHPGLLINCDTIGQIRRIGERAPGRTIGIRVNPGRGTGYQSSDRLTYSGERTTKFGIYREQWSEALATAALHGLAIRALHFHVGCGYLDGELASWEAAAQAVLPFVEALPELERINIGGGLGVPHRAGDRPLDLDLWAAAIRRHLGGRGLTVVAEPGDYLVKDAGVLLLGVTDVETKRGTRFVFVDGGFNLHPEPAFYDLPCEPVACVPRALDPSDWPTVTIAGNINEALDLWAADRPMPPLREGDRIALLNAGGYGSAMSSNHCMRGSFTEQLID